MQCSLWSHLVLILSIYHSIVLILAEPLQGSNIVTANPNEFPFIASLGISRPDITDGRLHFCTGTLITRKHVLTAEHCLTRIPLGYVDVIVGVADWKFAETKYSICSWLPYNKWFRHNKPSVNPKRNDVAIVKLSSIVNQPGIMPVRLTLLDNRQLYRTNAVIAGWGIPNGGVRSSVLQKTKVKILTNTECERRGKLMTNVQQKSSKKILCTAVDPHTLLSRGDSGGPLLTENNVLLGINMGIASKKNWGNFSDEFINKYKVNLHASVDYYRDFIMNVTRN